MKERDHHWRAIDAVIDAQDSYAAVSQSFIDSLADQLEYAVTSRSSASLEELDRQLTDLADHLMDTAPPRVSNFLHSSETADVDLGAALAFGQISFAQQLVTQAVSRRANDAFAHEMTHETFVRYLRELLKGPKTNGDLEVATSEATATVSRKLARLRELGITDFRKVGTRVVNFLTPNARAFMEQTVNAKSSLDTVRPGPANKLLQEKVKALEPYMRVAPTFANEKAA